MIITTKNITTKVTEFNNTATTWNGGFKGYHKLCNDAETLYLTTIGKIPIGFKLKLLYSRYIKPFKQFYHTKTIKSGKVTGRWSENNVLISFYRETPCIKDVTYYLFNFPFYRNMFDLTEDELIDILCDKKT